MLLFCKGRQSTGRSSPEASSLAVARMDADHHPEQRAAQGLADSSNARWPRGDEPPR
jgi:hypothetical protein